jgi:3',5'-cyclic AMP phosphodiesterase CpdA
MKFIHISDLHFKEKHLKNVSARALLDFIWDKYSDHKLIVTGDITNDGEFYEYQEASAALLRFNGNIFICPGNHDFGIGGAGYSIHRAERFDSMLSEPLGQGTFAGSKNPVIYPLEDNALQVLLIPLDTTLAEESIHDLFCGEVGGRQLAFLEEKLADPQYAGYTKLLFFHHHPFIHSAIKRLKDADKLLATIQGKVDIVCFGHDHVSGMWQDRDSVKYFLAADKSPDSDRFREIDITNGTITINEIRWP